MSRTPPIDSRAASLPLRVLVLASDPLVRAGLTRLLEEQAPDAVVVGEPGEADVALWDAGLIEELDHEQDLPLPTLALVGDETSSAMALAVGARGAVLRDADGTSVWAALVAVRHGLTVLDGAFAPPAVPHDARGIDELTAREREVLALLARGLSNRGIATHLGISDHTAKFHASAILAKLGATSRTEAVVIAARRGLVTL